MSDAYCRKTQVQGQCNYSNSPTHLLPDIHGSWGTWLCNNIHCTMHSFPDIQMVWVVSVTLTFLSLTFPTLPCIGCTLFCLRVERPAQGFDLVRIDWLGIDWKILLCTRSSIYQDQGDANIETCKASGGAKSPKQSVLNNFNISQKYFSLHFSNIYLTIFLNCISVWSNLCLMVSTFAHSTNHQPSVTKWQMLPSYPARLTACIYHHHILPLELVSRIVLHWN